MFFYDVITIERVVRKENFFSIDTTPDRRMKFLAEINKVDETITDDNEFVHKNLTSSFSFLLIEYYLNNYS